MNRIVHFRISVVFVASIVASGCEASWSGTPWPYDEALRGLSDSEAVWPCKASVGKARVSEDLQCEVDSAWSSCIQVARQHFGVIQVKSASRQIVFFSGKEVRGRTFYNHGSAIFPWETKRPLVRALRARLAIEGEVTKLVVESVEPTAGASVATDWEREEQVDFGILLAHRFIDQVKAMIEGESKQVQRLRYRRRLPSARSNEARQIELPLPQAIAYTDLSIELGNFYSARLRQTSVVVPAPHLQEFARKLWGRVAPQYESQLKLGEVYLIHGSSTNAVALSNGDIFVETGLLKAVENRDELAGVLLHEMDHVFHKDREIREVEGARSQERTQDLNGLSLVASLGVGVASQLAGLGPEVASAVTYGPMMMWLIGVETVEAHGSGVFRREQEFRADRNATLLLHNLGFDPFALRRFLGRRMANSNELGHHEVD